MRVSKPADRLRVTQWSACWSLRGRPAGHTRSWFGNKRPRVAPIGVVRRFRPFARFRCVGIDQRPNRPTVGIVATDPDSLIEESDSVRRHVVVDSNREILALERLGTVLRVGREDVSGGTRRIDDLRSHPVDDLPREFVLTRLEQPRSNPTNRNRSVSRSSDANRFTGRYGSSVRAAVTTASDPISIEKPLASTGSHCQTSRSFRSVSSRSISSRSPDATNPPSCVASYWCPSLLIQRRASNSRSVRPTVDRETPVSSRRSVRLCGRVASASSAVTRWSERARNSISSSGEFSPLLIMVFIRMRVA